MEGCGRAGSPRERVPWALGCAVLSCSIVVVGLLVDVGLLIFDSSAPPGRFCFGCVFPRVARRLCDVASPVATGLRPFGARGMGEGG